MEAMAELMFVKPTVVFVAVFGAVGLGEIACREMPEVDAVEGAGLGLVLPLRGLTGLDPLDLTGADPLDLTGAESLDLTGAESLSLTEKDLVARPAPPRHSSKPASTSMRYHDFLM